MQIFDLYSAIGTPILTKCIGLTKTFQTWRSNWDLFDGPTTFIKQIGIENIQSFTLLMV